MTNFSYNARTAKGVDFTGAIATNAVAYSDLVLPGCLRGINGNSRVRIKGITIESKENLSWEIWLFGSNTHQVTSDLDVDYFRGFWSFDAGDAKQIAAANQFCYYIDGLDVPYHDIDNSGQMHIGLVNRSVASKSAGAGGQIVLSIACEIEGP